MPRVSSTQVRNEPIARFVRRGRERAVADGLVRLGEDAEREGRRAAAAGDYETAYKCRRLAIDVMRRATSIYRAHNRATRAYLRTATPPPSKLTTAKRPKRDGHGHFAPSRNGNGRRNGHKRAPKRQPTAQEDEPPPARPCRCLHCWPFPDDLLGEAWIRCGACGHDVSEVTS